MTELEHLELLLAVVRVAPKELCAGIDVEYYTAWFDVTWDPEKPAQLRLDNDMIAAQACFAMLDAMEARDLEGLGPEVVIELCGSGNEWYCRRWVCPESDSPHKAQEGIGSTRAEAIARAFVAVFKTQEIPAR